MDRDTLQTRKAQLEARFNDLTGDKQKIEAEMNKISGQYEVITELLNSVETKKPQRLRKAEVEDAQD